MKRLLIILIAVTLVKADLREDVENTAESLIDGAASLISAGIFSIAGTHGGFEHFNMGLGVNMINFKFTHPLTGEQIEFPGVMPLIYGEVGILDGFYVSPEINGVGAIDIIGRVMPMMRSKDYFDESIRPLYWAGGVKIQLIKDQLVPPTPAFSVTIMYHSLENIGFEFDTLHTEFSLSDLSLHADFSKTLIFLSPFVGIGYDTYELNGSYWKDGDNEKHRITLMENHHLRYYGGVRLNILYVNIFLEGAYINNKTVFSAGIKAGR